MKRSKMIEELELRIGLSMQLNKSAADIADYVLTTVQCYGMIPPEQNGGDYDAEPDCSECHRMPRQWDPE